MTPFPKAQEFELRRELKEKDHELRREAMEFAKDKHQCDMIHTGVRALPHLQRVAEAMMDPDPTEYLESTAEARRVMFGPREEVKDAQEEAEAKREENNAPPEGGTPSQEEGEVKAAKNSNGDSETGGAEDRTHP